MIGKGTGQWNSFFASQHAPLVMKLDDAGNIQWQRMYYISGRDWGNAIKQTSDGGYVLAGGSDPSTSNQYYRGAILKLDSNGNIMWQHTYNTNLFADIVQTPDGGYAAVGDSSSSPDPTTQDITLLKLDASGTIEWQKTYGGPAADSPSRLQQTGDGGYIVAGATQSFGSGGSDVWALKLNSDGSVAWQKAYGGPGDEWPRSAVQTGDGGYVIGATTTSFAMTGQ